MNIFIYLSKISFCSLLFWGNQTQAFPDDELSLKKGAFLVEQEKSIVQAARQDLDDSGIVPDSRTSLFVMQIESQLFKLAQTFESALGSLGEPVHQSYKTRVCTETSHLIATSRAMVRVLKNAHQPTINLEDFQYFIEEFGQIQKDLRCL